MKLTSFSMKRCVKIPLGLITIVFLLSSCIDQGNLPDISEASIEKWDLPLAFGGLRYDIRPFLETCRAKNNGAEPSDWRELTYAHGITNSSSSFVTFNNLLPRNMTGYPWPSDATLGPKVSFTFFVEGYKGSICKEYTKFDNSLCMGSVVHDAPVIPTNYICDFSAHTISTSENHISIIWEQSFYLKNHDTVWIDSDETGTISPASPILKSTTGEGEVAVRVGDHGNEIVDNTISSPIVGGSYVFRPKNVNLIVSDVLLQPVLSGGRNSMKKWDIPRVGILIRNS